MDSKTSITKETKNKIRVDYEGKLSFKERLQSKLKASNTWIKVGVTVLRFIFMLGISYVILFPFFSKIANSFMSKEDIIDATVSLIPKHFTIDIYKYLIIENQYFTALRNTAIIALSCAIIQTFISCLIGYGLAKFKFKGNKLLMLTVVITMLIPHGTLEISMRKHFTYFDLFTFFAIDNKGPFELIFGNPLGLENSPIPLIILSICGIAFKNGLYIYLMRQFFKGVPDELEESAYVDGAGTLRTFFQIILPLAIPMMITVFIFSFSWQWTDEFYTTMFYPNTNKTAWTYLMTDFYVDPPPSLETNYVGQVDYYGAIRNTAGILIIAPLVVIYLFCQKYLVQGIERSGLVG